MNRVRIFTAASLGLALAALGWLLSEWPGALADISADTLSRSAGVALLGLVLLATGLVFVATRSDKRPAATATRPQASEYRRGFRHDKVQTPAWRRQAMQRGDVIAMRRVIAERGDRAAADPATKLSAAEVVRLQAMLHHRTAEMAKRSFSRSGVDQHGLTPR
jgi:hypothetical protein